MKNINWTIITDASAGAMALESGEIDYYYKVSNADFKHLSELPNLQSKIDEKGFGYLILPLIQQMDRLRM